MKNTISGLSITTNIFTEPHKAFKDIQQNYPILIPLSLIVALNSIIVIMLFINIDFSWYVEYMVESTAGDKSKEQQDQVRQGIEMMSPIMMAVMSVVSQAVAKVVIFCLTSLYYVIVSNINNDGFQFKQWLSFVSWTALPSLVSSLASFVVILASNNGQIVPETIDPLSLNALFFNLDAVNGIGRILASTSITIFWTIALMTIGYACWTKKSMLQSFLIVTIPYALYYGVRLSML